MRIGLFAAALAVTLGLGGTGAAAQDAQPAECTSAAAKENGVDAITIYPDVPIFAGQFGQAEVAGGRLKFRTRVIKLPAPRRGDRELVKVADGSQCGYVQTTRLLEKRRPLRVSDIFPDQQVQSGTIGYVRNEWTIKAMLRSNPKLDSTAHEATLFDAPRGEGKPFKNSRVFNLFNIFKFEQQGDDPEDWWYFIGGKNVTDNKVLSGWVRGGNLFLWGSGVAVYTNPTDKGAPFDVYTDIQALTKRDKGGLIATRSGLDPPGGRDIAKFPILDQIFQNPKIDRKEGKPPIAYEIGFFGEGCARGNDCYQSAQINDLLAKIGEIVRNAGKIDVMFVIDNTDSMTQYFGPIAAAVSRWATETAERRQREKNLEGRIRFGASVYGDYRDRNYPSIDNMDFRVIAQLGTDTSAFAQALTSVGPPYGDSINDQPEAGYAALVRAARETYWAADAGYRLLVWIGDQGVQRDPSKLARDPVDLLQVQQVLGDKNLYLAAINVAGSRPQVSTFMADAKRVLDRSKLALGVPPISTSEGGGSRDEPRLAAQKVTELLDVVLHFSKAVPEWIKSQRGKDADAPLRSEEPVPVSSKTKDLPLTRLVDVSDLQDGLFKRLGLTPDEVQRVLSLKQLMTKGLVSYDDRQRNISFYAAMEPSRFGFFHSSLTELCRAMDEDDDLRNRMLGLMLTLAHNLGGDPYSPSETIAEYFDRVIFIPKRHFASWLDKSATDLANVWGNAKLQEKNRLKLSVCRSAYLLQQMSLGRRVPSPDDLQFDNGKIQLRPGQELQPYNWLWSTESEIEYYFVPADYLPKD